MMQPACRRLLAKAMLDQEWKESIMQAHNPGPAKHAALANHHHNVGIIKKIFKHSLPILRQPGYLETHTNTSADHEAGIESTLALKWL